MTLVILAAGMGSRYGGLKQLDPMNDAGNFIIDFSIYDAIEAGFDKVVNRKINNKIAGIVHWIELFKPSIAGAHSCRQNNKSHNRYPPNNDIAIIIHPNESAVKRV